MKRQPNQPEGAPARGAGTVWRFLVLSAFLGLLIGLVEAARLWTTPRVIPLLVPDVGWVIWFLAPLADMAFFALVGLGLGLAASRTQHKELFVALGAGIAVTFVTLMVAWFHLEIGLHPFDFQMEVTTPLAVFGLVTFISFLVLAVVWPRFAALANRRLEWLLRPLARGLAACAAAAILGIGVFVVRPSFSGTRLEAAPPPQGAPNIVFITLDTVRADHLSSYGYSRPTTPNIDRFARSGVLFENAIAPSSWTLASHASMFTGLLPQQHGADWAVPLARSPWTLAEILRSQGYQTASFVANELYLQKGWGVSQGFDRYVDERVSLSHNLSETLLGTAIVQPVYRSFSQYDYFDRENAGQLNQRVFRWLRRNSQRPYFVFVNYFDAHEPYFPPAPYNRRFGLLSTAVASRLYEASRRSEGQSVRFDTADRDCLMAGYDNSLAYLDSQLGNLLKFLQQSPQWNNTVVIITSDHGEEFGGHGSYEHGWNLYRGVLHVPLIIAGPGIPQGVRIGHIAATRQLFSTILDLAGRGSTPFSRTSLARFWEPGFKPAPTDSAIVSELVPTYDPTAREAMVSLNTPDWHYIEHRDGGQELYNWKADPKEQNNLFAAAAEQATLEELRSRLVDLVGDAVGPWHGREYLDSLDSIEGPARLNLLRPQPFQPASTEYRIGMAQAFFKPDESAPTRPTKAEQELMRSLPYQ